MHRKNGLSVRRLAIVGGVCVVALLAAGCSSADTADESPSSVVDQDGTASTDPADAAQGSSVEPSGTAKVVVDGRTFDFELTTCLVTEDGEVQLSGPGTEAGSDVGSYFDGEATELGDDSFSEYRIEIGAGGPFESADSFIAVGNSNGGSYALSGGPDSYLVTASAWNENGDDLSEGTVEYECL